MSSRLPCDTAICFRPPLVLLIVACGLAVAQRASTRPSPSTAADWYEARWSRSRCGFRAVPLRSSTCLTATVCSTRAVRRYAGDVICTADLVTRSTGSSYVRRFTWADIRSGTNGTPLPAGIYQIIGGPAVRCVHTSVSDPVTLELVDYAGCACMPHASSWTQWPTHLPTPSTGTSQTSTSERPKKLGSNRAHSSWRRRVPGS